MTTGDLNPNQDLADAGDIDQLITMGYDYFTPRQALELSNGFRFGLPTIEEVALARETVFTDLMGAEVVGSYASVTWEDESPIEQAEADYAGFSYGVRGIPSTGRPANSLPEDPDYWNFSEVL